jgi:tripartite-type tricarboxylate transporter receptor subunit TctC
MLATRRHTLALLTLGAAASRLPALAADYPTRPLRLVSPYSPGGVADPVGRALAESMAKDLGQPVTVENRPGANTMVGIGLVANGAPDGYSMALVTGAMLNNVFLYKRMPYSPGDIKTIAVVYEGPYVFAINPKIPATTLKEFVAYAKSGKKKLNYASIATGSNLHLVPEMFKEQAGFEMQEVSYNGKSGEALMAVMTGEVDLMVTLVAQASPQILAGKLSALWPSPPRSAWRRFPTSPRSPRPAIRSCSAPPGAVSRCTAGPRPRWSKSCAPRCTRRWAKKRSRSASRRWDCWCRSRAPARRSTPMSTPTACAGGR